MFRHVVKEQLRVPAKIDYLGTLRDFVSKVGHKHGFSDRVINAFKLSIDEAATNIIKHAYRDWEGDITIRAVIKKNSLTVVLIDQGKFFDPRQVSDPDLKRYVDIGKKGGLGIFIMRRLLDDIDYRKTEEGNELRMVKYRDVARRRKIAVPSIPMSLKARYWLIANGIFTAVVIAIYLFSYTQTNETITKREIDKGRLACSVLATEAAQTLATLPEDELRIMATRWGGSDKVLEIVQGPMSTVQMSEHREIIYKAYLVDVKGMVIAPMDSPLFLEDFDKPQTTKRLQQDAFEFKSQDGRKVIDIVYPVLNLKDGLRLCDAHIFLDKTKIDGEIAGERKSNLNLALFVWVVGSAGLFLLIYIVMNPFRRLSEWVRNLSQPGVEDEMDIDASTEVGEIAKAFSDITTRLRESQVNLAEQERLQKEMQVAKEIQHTLLPGAFPEIEGYEISSFYEAAKEVGGDYFDFVEVDKDTLGIVVADVSGKGVPGSLVMTMIRTALRTEARGVKSASEVLSRVNDFVVNDMKKGMFVTLFYVIIDSKRRRLNYASAGHNPMILYRVGTKQTYYLNPRGFPLGISLPDKELFKKSIESDTIQLAEDDILIVYTDGITEAMNPQRELFGDERLLKVIREHGHLRVKPFIDELKDEIHSFTEGNVQNDDITLVAIREKTTAEKIELGRAKKAHQMILDGSSIREACTRARISTYAYYKYKEIFESEGVDAYEIADETVRVEAKHLSIEEKTKIFDIIRLHPEYGAKRISEELNTERYNNTQIGVSKIYEELVRSRLNTRELREAFVKSGGRKRRRLKPPGTPLLTLDGQIIMHRGGYKPPFLDEIEEPKPPPEIDEEKKATPSTEKPIKHIPTEADGRADLEKGLSQGDVQQEVSQQKDEREFPADHKTAAEIDEDLLLTTPLEDLLQKPESPAPSAIAKNGEDGEIREDLEPIESFDYASTTDNDDWDDSSQVTDLQIEPDSRLFEEIDSDELDIAKAIDDREGLDSPADELNESEINLTNSTIDDLVLEYAGHEMPDSEIEEGEIIEEHDTAETQEPEVVDYEAELAQPFDEILEIEEEQGLISPDGDVDVALTDQFVDELDAFLEETTEELERDSAKWDIREPQSFQFNERLDTYGENGDDEHRMSFTELMEFIDGESFSMQDNGGDSEMGDADLTHSMDEPDSPKKTKSGESNNLIAHEKDILLRKQKFAQALRYYESEQYEEAVQEAEKLVELFPNLEVAHTLIGNSYFRLAKYKQAAKAYEKAKELAPENLVACENLGVVYANQGDFKSAIREWEKVLEIDPSRSDISESIARAKRVLSEE